MAQMKGEFLLHFSRSGWGENSPENKGMSPENQWLVQMYFLFPRDPGSPKLGMVSWNLNTTCVSFR